MDSTKRAPSNEPTLMMGDLVLTLDCSPIDALVCNTFPCPVEKRKGLTKNEKKQNVFYQYASFEEARVAWKALNGIRIPAVEPDFRLDLTFAKQETEVCTFFAIPNVFFTRFEVYKLVSRYQSVLGLAYYQYAPWQRRVKRTSCFVRFADPDECMDAAREMHGMLVEGHPVTMTISARHIDELKEYVQHREADNLLRGIPPFHNFYEKRRVGRDEFNTITIDAADFFDDLEASRWTDLVFRTDVKDTAYARQMTINYFEHF
ncbi:unnamed protein product [Caenorhabditis sp. 36 PRJEB53466]|nr:unnamed protein product [Caenorhabditis sp. 36 PRJEB53466]